MGKTLCRILLIVLFIPFCAMAFSNTHPPAKGPVELKVEELRTIYQQKKAAGYDMTEVEKTMAQIRQARQDGDGSRFIDLLKKAEIQLAGIGPQEQRPAPETAPPPPLPADRNVSMDDGPWPMYGHDRRHTCRSPFRGLTSPPAGPKWRFPSPGGIGGFTSSVSIGSDGTIYAGTAQNENFPMDNTRGHSGMLMAFSPDGRKKWQHDSGRGSPMICMIESGPLLTSDGMIIYGKDDGHVYAVNRSGQLLWDFAAEDAFNALRHDDNEQFIPSPVLGPDNALYLLSHFGNVYKPQTIDALGRVPALKKVIDAYGIKGVKAQEWGKIYALDVRTGKLKWTFDPSHDSPSGRQVFFGSPAVGNDGTLYAAAYCPSNRGYLYAVNPDGTLKWRYPGKGRTKIQALCSPPAIGDDGTIYVGSFGDKDKARLYAFHPDGTLKWNYEITENRITSGPGIGPDGTLYFGSHNHPARVGSERPPQGHLYAVKDAGEKADLQWKFAVDYGITASPAIDNDGNVFFSTTSIQPVPQGALGDYFLFALNKKGEKLWEYPFKGFAWGSPAIDRDGTVYINVSRGEASVFAFGPQ
ncbi:MAG: PQQ-binding-like beta-propeller repeat protein [Thermodesulfobacteriota bacterium]